jgi:hypothetical protein
MNASSVQKVEVLQTLWSGYGEIVRLALTGAEVPSVILKHIVLPEQNQHPRGWNTDRSHLRKVRSYHVETAWYSRWSEKCNENCRIPRCFGSGRVGEEQYILLEDLDAAGFPARRTELSRTEIDACLQWLASFHATFLAETPVDLWNVGTYWHLATRPDELAAMSDKTLQKAAPWIDKRLNSCRFQTFVHGDAKVANFCFSEDGTDVAAVDFQYVGGGCGMKDVAYFLGSCLDEELCEYWEEELLATYFHSLRQGLSEQQKAIDCSALEQEWRELYPIAWTDFTRFLQGWMPTHWKLNGYTRTLATQVLKEWKETEKN